MRAPLSGLRLAGLLVAAVAWPGGPAVASAASTSEDPRGAIVATPRFLPAAGPVLAGDTAIVWVSRRDDAVLDLWAASPGGTPRRIQRFVGSDTTWLTAPRLAASGAAVGLELTEARAGSARALQTRAYLGALGQPLELVSSCAGAAPAQRSFDVQAAATVYRDGPGCSQVVVRGIGTAPGATHRLPDGAAAPRLAGAYEAWLEGSAAGAVVVRDSATGREITRAPGTALPSAITDVALRTDGTLALLHRAPAGGRGTRVALLDPGASRPRTLARTLLAARGARWIGDALAVVAARPADPRLGLLVLVDGTGATIAPVLAVGRDPDLMEHADLTASRAVWVQRGCAHAVIRTLALPAPAVAQPRAPSCGLRLRRPVRVRAGRLRLGVSCAGFAHACSARVIVRVGARLLARGVARPNHRAPPYAAADLRLTRAGRALLAGRSRVRVQISARIGASVRRTTRTIAPGDR